MQRLFAFLLIFVTYLFAQSNNIELKVSALFSKMTLQEKVKMIGGLNGFYIPAVPRLGIPEVKMSDGPLGIRGNGKSTAFPATMALSASWNVALAYQVGAAIGQECRSKGIGFLLAPAVNIYRAPMCGRNFEYFGEDPYLTATMASEYIKGVQSNQVVATIKHFVANNQEYDRHWVSSNVDERTLREIYFPAFKTAVQKAHVLAVMAAYNPLNGIHCSENKYLLTDLLKKEWGFKGLVMSDWGAVHSTRAIKAGLDLEMPEARFMTPENIIPKIKNGELKEEILNDKVRRILRVCLTMNLYDTSRFKPAIDWDTHHALAVKVAEEGIVLLKNENNLLPLEKPKNKKIVILGPTANPTPSSGGGSAYVKPYRHVSILKAFKALAEPEFKVDFINTEKYPPFEKIVKQAQFYANSNLSLPGLVAIFFNNMRLQIPPVYRRVDQKIDFNFGTSSPAFGVKKNNYSIRWRGYIKPAQSGKYVFATESDDGVRVYLDGRLILDNWTDHQPTINYVEATLRKNQVYAIRIDYYNHQKEGLIRFGYALIDETPLEQKLASVKNYDAAIVCVGFNPELEGEGHDRPFSLPEKQNKLIQTVASLNRNNIVVVTAGGGIDFSPWIHKVKAILHTFYLGQAGGTPVAEILLGKVNPSGKLPFTIEKKWEDAAAYDYYYPPTVEPPIYLSDFSNNPKQIDYGEGIFLGYRHFDKNKIEPQFPFGFGLSYTTFTYNDLKLSNSAINKDGVLKISFRVTNNGNRAGAEVVQLYLHKEIALLTVEKELKGFKKVFLEPKSSKVVHFKLTPEQLQVFNHVDKKWEVMPGKYEVLIGASSRDIRLRKKFLVKP